MELFYDQVPVEEWDRRAKREGLYAVFSTRWSYDECIKLNISQQSLVFELLPDLTRRTVLDVGCGIGRLTGPLSERAAYVVGVDISHNMLQKARQSVTRANVSFVRASASSLPFTEQHFDVIIAIFVLQHILNDTVFELTLNEMLRVLGPGGYILIIDGVGVVKHRPTNSQVTVIRTMKDYDPLRKKCCLLFSQELLCVEDKYTVMLWQDLSNKQKVVY